MNKPVNSLCACIASLFILITALKRKLEICLSKALGLVETRSALTQTIQHDQNPSQLLIRPNYLTLTQPAWYLGNPNRPT